MKVVLLHALPLDERMWEPQRQALAPLDVAAPRLYGRGRTMDEWASSLLEELDGELVVVGASMGGYCALALARQAPERIRGLVLEGARADADSPERRAGRADTIERVRREGAEGMWALMGPKLFPEDADPGVVEPARAIALEQQPDELVAAVEAIRDRADSTDVLRSLGERSLAVIGEHDPFVSGDEVPAHEVRVVPDCGHLPNLQRPDTFNEVVAERIAAWT
jgi:pimeloyl-ACP methyl ester carboxylesterase